MATGDQSLQGAAVSVVANAVAGKVLSTVGSAVIGRIGSKAVAVKDISAARIGQLRSVSGYLRNDAGIFDRAYRRQVIESFGSDIRVAEYSGSAYQYSGFAGTQSRYLTPTPLSNPIQELALPPSNSASIIKQYSIAPGKVLIGTASPQNFGYPLTGGAQQIFIASRNVLTPIPILPN